MMLRFLLIVLLLASEFGSKAQNIASCDCINDMDGDGISDCLDKCPNTIPGAGVNSHGCPLDTDGDGVPDFADHQLITPTECQPADSLGVGTCPCPCTASKSNSICSFLVGQYLIYFPHESVDLTLESKKILKRLAIKLKSNPSFKVVVQGYDQMQTSYGGQQRSWDHVYTVIKYLVVEEQLDQERFIFNYGQSKNGQMLILRSPESGEEGACIQPPPFSSFSIIPEVRKNTFSKKYWE